LAVMLGFCSFI